MKLPNLILALLLLALVFSCNKIDNYPAPNAGITGTVIDNTTNSGIQTEQPNGFQISLIEFGYNPVIPINFDGKADGSFENTQLFADKYNVIPINGPFLSSDTVAVDIKGLSKVNFTVTPFMSIDASTPLVVSNNVIVNYILSKPLQISYNIVKSMTIASSLPTVSSSVNDFNFTHNLSGNTYQQIASMHFSDTLKNLPSGTFYIRVGGQTDNPQNKFNYSKVFTVTIQ